MTAITATDLASGKGHRDENFPVASFILKAEHRAPVMAFYRFARAADDVADHPTATRAEKLATLGNMRDSLNGMDRISAEAAALHDAMAERGLSPRHALDLLTAFERDAENPRCQSWDDLMDYCRVSAMPVGRYVLDVHGEAESTWPASDALCAALQIINHLQDCAKDYHSPGRIYLPLAMLRVAGAEVTDLAATRSSPALMSVIVDLAGRAEALLRESAGFAAQIRDRRLAMEVAIIHRLAVSLVRKLKTRDPLCERVHHRSYEALALSLSAALSQMIGARR
jgi:hydroxysqualene synthase